MNTFRLTLKLVPAALSALILSPSALADSPRGAFTGFYGGVEVSTQNVIAGADINGVDVLVQDSRAVGSVVAGIRHQFLNGLVIGGESTLGAGDFSLDQRAAGFDIRYDANLQWSYGGILGFAPGGAAANTLFFVYVNETERTFSVEVSGPGGNFGQRDEQGLLRYGAGIERAFDGGWSIRASIGSSRADFGDADTSFDPEHPADFSLALIRRF
jgi:hypothetical protein